MGARATLWHDEGLVAQFIDGDPLAVRERMRDRQRNDGCFLREGANDQVPVQSVSRSNKDDIQTPGNQFWNETYRLVFDKLRDDPGNRSRKSCSSGGIRPAAALSIAPMRSTDAC